MICEHCGGMIEDDSRFCPLCGTKITAPAEPEKKAEAELQHEVPLPDTNKTVTDPDAPVIHESMTAPGEPAAPGKPFPAPAGTSPMRDAPRGYTTPGFPNLPPERAGERMPPYSAGRSQSEFMGARPLPPAKQKEFFGVGAFVACLAMIGVLAVTAGVFAFLYFSVIGVI